MITSRLDAYISRYGDFCANDNDNDDTTDYFTPCACAQGNDQLKMLYFYTIANKMLLAWFSIMTYPGGILMAAKSFVKKVSFSNPGTEINRRYYGLRKRDWKLLT